MRKTAMLALLMACSGDVTPPGELPSPVGFYGLDRTVQYEGGSVHLDSGLAIDPDPIPPGQVDDGPDTGLARESRLLDGENERYELSWHLDGNQITFKDYSGSGEVTCRYTGGTVDCPGEALTWGGIKANHRLVWRRK